MTEFRSSGVAWTVKQEQWDLACKVRRKRVDECVSYRVRTSVGHDPVVWPLIRAQLLREVGEP
jgi:hypothetical protein